MSFYGKEPEDSAVDIDLQADFSMDGSTTTVKGFYAGNGVYKLRFYPERTGIYTYQVKGIFTDRGSLECEESNLLGMVRAEECHFVYQDGTLFHPFGTTVYALLHQPRELIEQTFVTLEKAPFNKVRLCVFPKHCMYNENDPELYPFEKNGDGGWDVHHPCYRFWDHLEDSLKRLSGMGIQSDLILFHPYDCWGFSSLSQRDNLVYLDYVMRRLSAYPGIWWSIANEYDLVFHRTMEEWYELEAFILENDPYGHLISNHNCMKLYDFSRPGITHCCVQTSAMHMAKQWRRKYRKPVVFDECCYEGDIEPDWGNISGFEMTNRFWKACSLGAYASHGETFYNEKEILWWSKGGALKGESPARIGFLLEILENLPGALSPWEERDPGDPNNEKKEENAGTENPFIRLMNSLSDVDRTNLEWKSPVYAGHIGRDVYLKYYGNQCIRVASILLPEEGSYKIELLDAWNMTRKTLKEHAAGHTALMLPGREGMAVLAVREGEM